MLNLRLNGNDTYNYLKGELILGLPVKDAKLIQVYINEYLPEDSPFDEVSHLIPKNAQSINGICKGYYVSYYFKGKVFLISDMKRRITYAKIEKEYEIDVTKLFLTSLFRSHMNRYWIALGYHVYHACGIYDYKEERAFLVAGASGTGKTTFALEALGSERYRVISEDKVVINPMTGEMYGSPIVHVKEAAMERYQAYMNQYQIINGGTQCKKYSFLLHENYYMRSANLCYTIFLNQSDEQECSKLQHINDERRYRKVYKESQDGIYLPNEAIEEDKAYEYIKSRPVFELYRNKEDLNFEVFQRDIGKELYDKNIETISMANK